MGHHGSTLTLWTRESRDLLAFAVTPRYLTEQLGGIWSGQQVQVAVLLSDAEGRHVLGVPAAAGALEVVRTAPDVRLPWTIRVADTEPATSVAAAGARRRLLLQAIAFAAIVLIAGSGAFVIRAVQRELAGAPAGGFRVRRSRTNSARRLRP